MSYKGNNNVYILNILQHCNAGNFCNYYFFFLNKTQTKCFLSGNQRRQESSKSLHRNKLNFLWRWNGGNSRAIVRSNQLSPGRTCGRRRSRSKTSDWPFYFPAAPKNCGAAVRLTRSDAVTAAAAAAVELVRAADTHRSLLALCTYTNAPWHLHRQKVTGQLETSNQWRFNHFVFGT